MTYTPTTWVNDTSPYINATNLNKIETGIDEAHDIAERLLSPLNYGAIGDGTTDDTVALQAAIDAADGMTSKFGAPVVVDLQGKSYGISASLGFTDINRVVLQNGRLVAVGTWSDTYMINFDGVDAFNRCHGNALYNLVLDCNSKAEGIYLNYTMRIVLRDVTISKYKTAGTGLTTAVGGVNPELTMDHVICHQGILSAWGETPVSPDDNSIGFNIQSADFVMMNCVAHSNGVQTRFGGDGGLSNGQLIGNHFYGFNRANSTVSTTADSGGEVKITTTAAHGLTTGCYVLIEDVTGTTEANGYWQVTVVDTTNFTLDGSVYASAYTAGGTVYSSAPAMIVEDDCAGLVLTGNYFDAVVTVFKSFNHIATGNMVVAGASGLGACLILVAVTASEDFAGFQWIGGRMKQTPKYTVGAGGSLAAYNAARVFLCRSADPGTNIPASGGIVVNRGEKYMPGVSFSSATALDNNTGFYSPADEEAAIVCGQNDAAIFKADSVELYAADTLRWTVSTTGFYPDAAYYLGLSTNPIGRMYANSLRITDGISAPGTEAGYAVIYVDSADGDLKVKFGDGTVATIAVDT